MGIAYSLDGPGFDADTISYTPCWKPFVILDEDGIRAPLEL